MTKHVNDVLMPPVQGQRVFVGLSGGVDSAVTAALLKDAGADVTGVFIKGWYPPGMPCTWAADRRDAMRVAARLGIPFVTLDASTEYKAGVIDYLIREYRAGRTPNPDIMCNRDVKFGAFHAFAKANGADFIATGHYARTELDGADASGKVKLLSGIDEGKDQSYFLWAVPKEAIADTLFPLGGMHKAEVRKLAKQFGLPNATKKDSQGICFLGSISVEDFLKQELEPAMGKALDTEGGEVGTHDGAVLYTLGERIALPDAPPGPWYVVAKDLETNTITVTRERFTPTQTPRITLIDTNWLDESRPGEILIAQYRYHGPKVEGSVEMEKGSETAVLVPTAPITEPLASGQSLVLYRGDVCIGGGIMA